MKKLLLAGAAVLAVTPALSDSLHSITTTTARTETAALIGLQWNFGTSAPEIVLGFRTTNIRPSGSVWGGKFDVAIPLDADKWRRPTVRVLGVGGRRDVLAEAGLGYSFASSSIVIGAGVQAPFVNVGVNFTPGSTVMPYFGVNSFTRPKGPKKTTTTPSAT